MKRYREFNRWLANTLGNSLSAMEFFYICVVLDLFELAPVIQAHDVITWCTYLSQTVIQLVALPILGAQNKLQSESHKEIHDKLDSLHKKHDKVLKHIKEHMK